MWVTIVSLWSSLEGSILFWGFDPRHLHRRRRRGSTATSISEYMPFAIGTWLACARVLQLPDRRSGQSVPQRRFPLPLDGPGPNPLLQNHMLMIIHPPLLYLGYVGHDHPVRLRCRGAAARPTRPRRSSSRCATSLLLPWIFLTIAHHARRLVGVRGARLGRLLGVGSGGERVAAAVAHGDGGAAFGHRHGAPRRPQGVDGHARSRRRFLLTILGTFMTRSGVFNSVHSFTQSAIGPTILVFLAAVAALLGRPARAAHRLARSRGAHRERRSAARGCSSSTTSSSSLLTFTVLIGTVFPLVVEAVNGKQMSVGRPYFDEHGRAGRHGAAVPPRRRSGAAVGTRRSREQMLRALLPPLITGAVASASSATRSASRNAVDAAHAALRRLRGAGDVRADVAAAAAAHEEG